MKKLSEQLRAHNKTESSSGPLGLGSDLNQILSSFLERSGTGHGKGSRFQHAEKLQFAKVTKIFAIRILSIHSCPLFFLLSSLFLFLPTFVCPSFPHSQEEDAPVAVEATSEEDLQRQREEELTTLRQQLDEWSSKYEKLELDIKKYTAGK